MTLDGVLTTIHGDDPVQLLASAHQSLSIIEEEPFYIGTQFKRIEQKLNYRFILVSAPGATGKSAFGKHVAYLKNALYWNLADISIGDGTFQGTLYRALGASRISEYAQKLQSGSATLVIDAFDEAEIISGRKSVETFIIEANEFLEDAIAPSIILLSRTETAQNIASLFKNNGIPYAHYEIDYFADTQAKEFVRKTAEKRKKTITPAVEECIQQYFTQIGTAIQDAETRKRFLGYAPVLEAIAAHIVEIPNTSKLLSALRDNTGDATLIRTIMDNLLDREHQKFIEAFQKQIKNESDKISDWNSIYSKEEQLIRILSYILFQEIEQGDYSTSAIPPHLISDYLETIKLFLPQHPFLQNAFQESQNALIDFAGPAFRDYCLATIILDPKNESSAELYYQQVETTSHFPSQLFWEHYIELSENRIKSNHFTYVHEAYKAKVSIGCQSYLDIVQDADGAFATFRIVKQNEVIESTELTIDVSDVGFDFNNLINTSINVECPVSLGNGDKASIVDSTIICQELTINAKSLSISSFDPSVTTICSTLPIKIAKLTPLSISISGDGEIQVDTDNIASFPKLMRYYHSLLSPDSIDIYSFVHFLRKIFSSFRTHKKDMPARDAEKIDYVTIAGSPLKKQLFDFLLNEGIVFKSAHLYKVSVEKMSSFGISWGALINTDIKQLKSVYDSFCAWCRT